MVLTSQVANVPAFKPSPSDALLFKKCLCRTLTGVLFSVPGLNAACSTWKLSELCPPLLFFNKVLKGKLGTN